MTFKVADIKMNDVNLDEQNFFHPLKLGLFSAVLQFAMYKKNVLYMHIYIFYWLVLSAQVLILVLLIRGITGRVFV